MSISVVVPIHNTPVPVLRQALDCLVVQNFNDYEIICVDDSSDNIDTLNLLKQYEKDYAEKIKVIYLRKNIGAANSRNVGLDNAKGDYCIFLDSDDVFDKDLLEMSYYQILKEKADVCLFGYEMFNEGNGKNTTMDIHIMDFDVKSIQGREDYLVLIPASGWNRLCRTQFLRDNDIRFQSLSTDNDMFFSLMTLLCTKNVTNIQGKALISYRYNTPYQISNNMNPLNLVKAIAKVKSTSKKRAVFDDYNRKIDFYTILTGILELQKCKCEQNAKEFYEIYKEYLVNNVKMQNGFLDNRINLYIETWMKEEFETRWFDKIGNYEGQLEENSEELLCVVNHKKRILWGRGKRAEAFLKWSKRHNIKIDGVCDEKNRDIGKYDSYGNLIVYTQDVLMGDSAIIASNHMIYQYLEQKAINMDKVVDLESFCPL